MKKLISLSAIALLAFGCGDDDGPMDTGMDVQDDTTQPDTTPPDTTPPDTNQPDTPSSQCTLADYAACDATSGCPIESWSCVAELPFTVPRDGDDDDRVYQPDGTTETSYSSVLFSGGQCTPGMMGRLIFPECTTDEDCGGCGTCAAGIFGEGVSVCMPNCTAALGTNGDCRDGYSCLPLNLLGGNSRQTVCAPVGCSSDAECQVSRQDTNGIPGIQTPRDCLNDRSVCGGNANNFDKQILDPDGGGFCNMNNFSCENMGTPGAEAGAPCTTDAQCEAGGRCLAGVGENGFCTKLACGGSGGECAGNGVCNDAIGVDACLPGCTIGMVDADEAMWVGTGSSSCAADDQVCFWDGMGGPNVANNGGCFPSPDSFNDVATRNIGAACTSDADCWSPFGLGSCRTLFGDDEGSYCVVSSCNAPFEANGTQVDLCGADATCLDVGAAFCFGNCNTPADCATGLGCVQLARMGSASCLDGCFQDSECQTGYTCAGGVPGMRLGECMMN